METDVPGYAESNADRFRQTRKPVHLAPIMMRGLSSQSRPRPDDARLVALITAIAAERSRAAFAELFRAFAPRLKAYVMRAGADGRMAEDVVQEAMIAVWRKADSFNPEKASVSTWIFTIVRNKRIDYLRREARPDLKPSDFLHLENDQTHADDEIDDQQTGDSIQEALAGLPLEQAQVLELAYFEDKSHREIAEQLNLPLGTVKSRIRLALARMKGSISDMAS
jgi:RNA polymerase sigma-70 factor (ECF subfamily)